MAYIFENRFIPHPAMAGEKHRAPVVALLVVLALLVCHGSLSSTSGLVLEPSPTAAVHQETGETGSAAGHSAEYSSLHIYYYVIALCVVLLGSFFGLLLKNGFRRQRVLQNLLASKRHSMPGLLYGRGGPTAQLLKVFRL